MRLRFGAGRRAFEVRFPVDAGVYAGCAPPRRRKKSSRLRYSAQPRISGPESLVIDEHIWAFELAEFAERELRARRDCEILSPAEMGIVAFRFGTDDELQTKLVERMLSDGFAFLTSTTLKGRIALRLCTINPRTTEEDIVQTIDRLEKFAVL